MEPPEPPNVTPHFQGDGLKTLKNLFKGASREGENALNAMLHEKFRWGKFQWVPEIFLTPYGTGDMQSRAIICRSGAQHPEEIF